VTDQLIEGGLEPRTPKRTKRHTEAVQHSSVFTDWGTPWEVFRPLDRHFCFVLDVCASAENKKVDNYFGLDHPDPARRDALTGDWLAAAQSFHTSPWVRPVAFMNPPFARDQRCPIDPWIEKAAYEASLGLTVIGVIPASVQTRWWREHVRKADEIWFVTKRINFVATAAILAAINAKRLAAGKKPVDKAWSAGNNSAIVVWRPDPGFVGAVEPVVRYWNYLRDGAIPYRRAA
jgi:phage N-6-adenine-methyltransferase